MSRALAGRVVRLEAARPLASLTTARAALVDLGAGLAAAVEELDGLGSAFTAGLALAGVAAAARPGDSMLGDLARALVMTVPGSPGGHDSPSMTVGPDWPIHDGGVS